MSKARVEEKPEPASDPPASAIGSAPGAWLGLLADLALAGVALALAAWLCVGDSSGDAPATIAVASRSDGEAAGLTLRLGADNHLTLDGQALDEAALLERLAGGTSTPRAVAVEASSAALFANLDRTVRLLRQAGVAEVRLSIVP